MSHPMAHAQTSQLMRNVIARSHMKDGQVDVIQWLRRWQLNIACHRCRNKTMKTKRNKITPHTRTTLVSPSCENRAKPRILTLHDVSNAAPPVIRPQSLCDGFSTLETPAHVIVNQRPR